MNISVYLPDNLKSRLVRIQVLFPSHIQFHGIYFTDLNHCSYHNRLISFAVGSKLNEYDHIQH